MTKIRKVAGILSEIDTATNQVTIDGILYSVDQQKLMAVNLEKLLLENVSGTLYDGIVVAVTELKPPPQQKSA